MSVIEKDTECPLNTLTATGTSLYAHREKCSSKCEWFVEDGCAIKKLAVSLLWRNEHR